MSVTWLYKTFSKSNVTEECDWRFFQILLAPFRRWFEVVELYIIPFLEIFLLTEKSTKWRRFELTKMVVSALV